MHNVKIVSNRLVLATAVTIVLAMELSAPQSAKTQEKTRRTISLMFYYPKTATPPVKLHDLKIDGKAVNFSSMFEEGNKMLQKKVTPDEEIEVEDDFLEKMTFRVTNEFDKRVTLIRFVVNLYTEEGVRKRSFDGAIPIDFGRPLGIPHPWGINPDETETISIPDEMFPDIRKVISNFGAKIVRVGVYASSVYFDDGSHWNTSGKFYPSK